MKVAKPDLDLSFGFLDLAVLCRLAGAEVDGDIASLDYPPWVVTAGKRVTRALFGQAYDAMRRDTPRAYALAFAFGMMNVGSKKLVEDLSVRRLPAVKVTRRQEAEFTRKLVRMLYDDEKATLPSAGLVSVEVRREVRKKESKLTSAEMEDFIGEALLRLG